jgi:nucleoside-diphosphate-sugar epimerase
MSIVDARISLFCFGYGYVASALAAAVALDGWRCAGTCRTDTKCRSLAAKDVTASLFDRDLPLANCAETLSEFTHVLVSVPPDEMGDPVLDLHRDDLFDHGRLQWIGYLSTTGVYGDCNGDWVDETASVRPTSERGKRRAAAESRWLEFGRNAGVPVQIFRLAGIYGPSRNSLAQLRAGTARRIYKEGQVFGRIHIDDIVEALCASIDNPNFGAIYNVADDLPAAPDEVISYAAQLLGMEPPPLEDIKTAEMSEMGRSFYTENKRVSNRRLKDELGLTLKYPNYRVGLRALM